MEKELQKLIDHLQKIHTLAQSISDLMAKDGLSASDWAQIGFMHGELDATVDTLRNDMIAITHDLYNPIPVKKLS